MYNNTTSLSVCLCICSIVIGGMIVDKLEEMVLAAKGRPVILVNPNLMDRPSSNNMMQIRGRAVWTPNMC